MSFALTFVVAFATPPSAIAKATTKAIIITCLFMAVFIKNSIGQGRYIYLEDGNMIYGKV